MDRCAIFLIFLFSTFLSPICSETRITLSADDERALTSAYGNAVNNFGVDRVELLTEMRDLYCEPCSRCSFRDLNVRAFCEATVSEGLPITWVCNAQEPENYEILDTRLDLTMYDDMDNSTAKRPFTMMVRGHCTMKYNLVTRTDPSLPTYTPECNDPVDPAFLGNNGKLIPGGICDPFYYERTCKMYDRVMQSQKDAAIEKCCRYNYKYFRDGDRRYRICQ